MIEPYMRPFINPILHHIERVGKQLWESLNPYERQAWREGTGTIGFTMDMFRITQNSKLLEDISFDELSKMTEKITKGVIDDV